MRNAKERIYMITCEYVTVLRIAQELNWNGEIDRQVYWPFHSGSLEIVLTTVAVAGNTWKW